MVNLLLTAPVEEETNTVHPEFYFLTKTTDFKHGKAQLLQ